MRRTVPDVSPLAHRLVQIFAPLGSGASAVRAGLRWMAEHTGLPVVVIAAIALVTSFRIFRHTLRFVIEVAVTTAVLFIASRFGLLTW